MPDLGTSNWRPYAAVAYHMSVICKKDSQLTSPIFEASFDMHWLTQMYWKYGMQTDLIGLLPDKFGLRKRYLLSVSLLHDQGNEQYMYCNGQHAT